MFGNGSYLPYFNHEDNQGSPVGGMYSSWDNNAYNSNLLICDLCGSNHSTYTCMKAQNMDYYGEFEHYNSCFDQYGTNCDNSYAYGWNNQCAYGDSSYFYDYQPNCARLESKPSWELAIEKLANTPLPWEQANERLANDSKPSWEEAIQKLANATFDHFDRVEKRVDELASHFEGLHDQLHALCEVMSCRYMQIDPKINGRNVACEDGVHFDENDESYLHFNDEISISHDDVFGMNFEPQEECINDAILAPFEECFNSAGSNDIFPQKDHEDVPLVNFQAVIFQENIFEMLEIEKPLLSPKSFEDKIHGVEPPFVDPPRPKLVDYSLRKPP